MLRHPRTTLAGYGLVAFALAAAIYRVFWMGQAPDYMALFNLLTGLGLIGAADGGH